MNQIEAQRRVETLRRDLNRHNYLYYVEARPEIADRDYDLLYDELKRLEEQYPALITPDSPTQRVGGQPLKAFANVTHLVPMLSLDKAEDLRELKLFESRVHKELAGEPIAYVVEPKVDGVSVSVHYERGVCKLGVTRGDGRVGDDITANLKTIHEIPLVLKTKEPPELIEIRGEVFMSEAGRRALNARLEAEGEKPFPNSRNATAGSLKLLDAALVKRRPLRAVFYGVGATRGITFETHRDELETLRRLGVPVPQLWWTCASVEEALERAEELKRQEHELPYDIDGVVIKIDRLDQVRRLGRTAKAPASAIAYKPKHWLKQTETTLRDITVQVGRTGVLTPVAELEPVFLDGTQISRATLHNEDEIKRKDIRVGDRVVIERAGRVIPAVVRVLPEQRTGRERAFHMPSRCPVCGGPVVRKQMASADKEEVALRCENLQCPAQKTRRIEYFAARRALDIEGLGGVVADTLVERGLAQDPLDLFSLPKKLDELASLNLGTDEQPRVLGSKNAERIVRALDRSRSLPLSRWLFGLAVPNVGEATAHQLAAVHGDLEAVADSQLLKDIVELDGQREAAKAVNPRSPAQPPRSAAERGERVKQYEALRARITELEERLQGCKLPEVGPVVAASVLEFFKSGYGHAVLRRLKELGISPGGEGAGPAAVTRAGPLGGKTVVITGTLRGCSRDEAREALRQRGANVTDSVSRRTDYLIAGSEPGSKLDKARELGVKILNEEAFLELLK